MKIMKTEQSSEGKLGELRARLPGVPEIQIDERGKLIAQVTAWVPDGKGSSEQLQVVLTDGDIERLLTSLANPKNAEASAVISKLMSENLRNILRLGALGSGTALLD
ncbi:hypothetical protein [Pollutimonas harenae]|uniref:Uncharacterized protein n=1 Tax=Pollutimonas harenae TaxID=657015 RepID=A0A853GYJ6_9BURK|nr:hypothetical protein [Pollutimonas harenae]NYT85806.1 hypothetical protein [Pollutimonas harenae]TEA70868.1 hypothetical protein ERD84_09410 [Pollutimonas harenae]